MLCRVDYDNVLGTGVHTALFYINGQLGRILDPGGAVTDFSYVTNNGKLLLTHERDAVQSDWVASVGGNITADASASYAEYDSLGRAMDLNLASPTGSSGDSANTPRHNYSYYSSTETRTTVAGLSPPQGFATRAHFDGAGRTTDSTDPQGITITNTWDVSDNLLSTTNSATGRETTKFYDADNRLTDTYGPAQSSCFGSDLHPTSECSSTVAHSSTAYDENIKGLTGAFWPNTTLTGSPTYHEGTDWNGGSMNLNWGASGPAGRFADNWSARYTGKIKMDSVGNYTVSAPADDGARVWIDDTLVYSHWTGESSTTQNVFNNATAGALHRIRVEFVETTGNASLDLQWIPPSGGSATDVSGSNLFPDLGLVTSTTTQDSTTNSPSVTTKTNYSSPEYGLVSSTVTDPSGLALSTQSTFEPLTGAGSAYLRQVTKTLPAGNQTTYTYYGNSDTPTNPCGGSTYNQGGMLSSTSNPAPGTGTQIIEHHYYDNAGRTIASWQNTDSPTCTSYDTRGRVTTVSIPAYGGSAARTITYNYNTTTTPLTTSVADSAGTISTTTDLDERATSTTDVWGKTTTTTYDIANRAISSTGPNGTVATDYDLYNNPQRTKLDGNEVGLYYFTNGELALVESDTGTSKAGNGTYFNIYRDSNTGKPTTNWVRHTSDYSQIARDDTSYSQSGRVVDESVDGSDVNTSGNNFQYDTAGRLTKAFVAGHTLTYGFANNSSCSGNGGLTNSGLNSDRMSLLDNSTTTSYCYDNADRLVWTGDSHYTSPSYDSHGNTTSLGGTTMTYDMNNRHVGTTSGGSTVTYTRDALDRIVERKLNGTTTARYSYCDSSDSPCATLDGSSNVVERNVSLVGGAVITKRTSGGDVWSYPNIHGDVMTTTDGSGVKQGSTFAYDPFGQPLNGQPDNAGANFDKGWLGSNSKFTEHEGSLDTVEMGARQYASGLGRFLSVDPVAGGSANDYDYVNQDPINNFDFQGTLTNPTSLILYYGNWAMQTANRIYGDLTPAE
jgi:RHS repeat-associated protein